MKATYHQLATQAFVQLKDRLIFLYFEEVFDKQLMLDHIFLFYQHSIHLLSIRKKNN